MPTRVLRVDPETMVIVFQFVTAAKMVLQVTVMSETT
jgi:hypothetical protein